MLLCPRSMLSTPGPSRTECCQPIHGGSDELIWRRGREAWDMHNADHVWRTHTKGIVRPCGCEWLNCAKEVLRLNKIKLKVFAKAVYDCRNIILLGNMAAWGLKNAYTLFVIFWSTCVFDVYLQCITLFVTFWSTQWSENLWLYFEMSIVSSSCVSSIYSYSMQCNGIPLC